MQNAFACKHLLFFFSWVTWCFRPRCRYGTIQSHVADNNKLCSRCKVFQQWVFFCFRFNPWNSLTAAGSFRVPAIKEPWEVNTIGRQLCVKMSARPLTRQINLLPLFLSSLFPSLFPPLSGSAPLPVPSWAGARKLGFGQERLGQFLALTGLVIFAEHWFLQVKKSLTKDELGECGTTMWWKWWGGAGLNRGVWKVGS